MLRPTKLERQYDQTVPLRDIEKTYKIECKTRRLPSRLTHGFLEKHLDNMKIFKVVHGIYILRVNSLLLLKFNIVNDKWARFLVILLLVIIVTSNENH